MMYICAFFKYLLYLLRHKYYVFVECCKAGIPWRGFTHDFSKFLPSEFFPYMKHFYIRKNKVIAGGYIKQADTVQDPAFDKAWQLHIKRNPHHWQYWVTTSEQGVARTPKVSPMPDCYWKEMIADWRGAGRAQGYGDNTLEWYEKHKDSMLLHPETRGNVEAELLLIRR
ncbi:MAG: hypothetical protein KO464_02315 [Candidatus Methanofastidiosum sp.]|nr:hypothetical protein [Methanofastidiosum sp.]